jgi:hypothetical protein
VFIEPKQGTSLKQACHHEAGHAWCALALGWRIEQIDVRRAQDGSGYSGFVRSAGWFVPDGLSLQGSGWLDACWTGSTEQVEWVENDVRVTLAGWVAESVYSAKAKGKNAKIEPHDLIRPTLSAFADFLAIATRVQLLDGCDGSAGNKRVATLCFTLCQAMEEAWRSKIQVLAAAIESAPDVGGTRSLAGDRVHELLGYAIPDELELDKCPRWSPRS